MDRMRIESVDHFHRLITKLRFLKKERWNERLNESSWRFVFTSNDLVSVDWITFGKWCLNRINSILIRRRNRGTQIQYTVSSSKWLSEGQWSSSISTYNGWDSSIIIDRSISVSATWLSSPCFSSSVTTNSLIGDNISLYSPRSEKRMITARSIRTRHNVLPRMLLIKKNNY